MRKSPQYYTISINSSQLFDRELDYLLAISTQQDGNLYIYLSNNGSVSNVHYETADQLKSVWSPTTDESLKNHIINNYFSSGNNKNPTEALQAIVRKELGEVVDVLRIRKNT